MLLVLSMTRPTQLWLSFRQQHEFTLVQTPVLTSHDCEGGGEVFRVEADTHPSDDTQPHSMHEGFFGKPVYTTVSGQLHAEIIAHAMTRVYAFGPCFRAEPSVTSRHLSEF